MFQFFRRKDKAVRYFLGGLLVMICVAMVITLIPGMTGGGSSDETVVARVGSDKITSTEVARQLQMMTRNSRLPASIIPMYAPTVLNQMITERTTMIEAQRLGLKVGPEEVSAVLRSNPGLFPNGQFIGYDQYRQIVEQRYGLSVPEFEVQFERTLLAEKLRRFVTAGVTVSDPEVLREFHRRNDKTKISYVVVKNSDVRDKVQISDAELNDYFQKNRKQYEMPEQREFRVAFVDTSKVKDATQVSDNDLRSFYNENRERFRVQDRVKVAHILFKTMGKTPAETEDVRKKAQDVVQKLQGGADFAQTAKQYSDDAASTPKGGDLGWLVHGQTAPEFEKTAFSLDPGKMSGVVQTPIGFEIIKVEDRQRAHLQTLEEVKTQIEPEVKATKAQREVETQARKIDEAVRKSKGKINDLASQLGVSVVSTGMIKRGDPVAGAAASPALDDALFAASLKPTQTTDAVQVSNGVVAAQLVKVSPAHPAELAEVRDRVENDLRGQKSLETAQTRVKMLASAARNDGLEKAAAALGLKARTSEPFTADGTIKDVGSATSLNVEKLKPGDIGGPIQVGDGQVVFRVESREAAPDSEFAAAKGQLRIDLEQLKAMDFFQVFLDASRARMEKEGKLTINKAALDRLAASFAQ